MTAITLDTPVARKGTAATAEIDGQLVALDTVNGACYGLNHVATRIWSLIEAPSTPDAIVAALLQEYAVDEEMCRGQTLELLADLQREGLIVLQESAR